MYIVRVVFQDSDHDSSNKIDKSGMMNSYLNIQCVERVLRSHDFVRNVYGIPEMPRSGCVKNKTTSTGGERGVSPGKIGSRVKKIKP